MSPTITMLPMPAIKIGEGPHWDSERRTLFYVNPFEKYIYRYVPDTGEYASTKVDSEHGISFIIPVSGESDQFVINLGHKYHVVRWDGQTDSRVEFVHVIAELDVEHPANSTNDAKVDPRGRLFTGTIGVPEQKKKFDPEKEFVCVGSGSVYSITSDGSVKKHDSGVYCSNGIALDIKRKAMYHVDTWTFVVRKFHYDVETGDISNKSILFDCKKANVPGYPDGMTIDTDGNLWVAFFEGSAILKIHPDTGEVLQTLKMPTKIITSATFGGPNLDVLYVTTGSQRNDDGAGGRIYAVSGLGVRGYENLPFEYKVKK